MDYDLLIRALQDARAVAKGNDSLLAGINIATHCIASALSDADLSFSYADFTSATGMES